MKLLEALHYGFANYANFRGRTNRATFWWWVLAVLVIMIVLGIVDAAIMSAFPGGPDGAPMKGQPLGFVAALALFIPQLSIAVRRLHDIGKSGWWILIGLVPFVGQLILLYFYVQPSST